MSSDGANGASLVVDVSDWPSRSEEQMGSKRKIWIEDQGLPGDLWLFKYVRTDSNGRSYGDDWAEYLAFEYGRIFGIPVPIIRMARRYDAPGVICKLMTNPRDAELVHGNELLEARVSDYDPTIVREHPLYTVPAVRDCLAAVQPPVSAPELANFSAFDVWTGYVVFDAWIANTDRHHENWGVLTKRGTGDRSLAPSFDHGSSLGFNVSPRRLELLATDETQLARWCARGKSTHFAGRPSLVEVAVEALRLAAPSAANHWRERLANMDACRWQERMTRVPQSRMSELERRFVPKLLATNRRRLLDACA